MNEINEENGRKVTIDLVKANLFSIFIMAAALIGLLVPYIIIWREQWRSGAIDQLLGTHVTWGLFFVGMVVGVVVHELIHGLTWALFAKSGWKSISFGVIWKMLTPYCHCNEPMKKRPYIVGALMPLIVLGIVPALVALSIGNFPLLLWGVVFIAAAAGDIWMAWLLSKESRDCTVLDHPSEAGFYVFD